MNSGQFRTPPDRNVRNKNRRLSRFLGGFRTLDNKNAIDGRRCRGVNFCPMSGMGRKTAELSQKGSGHGCPELSGMSGATEGIQPC